MLWMLHYMSRLYIRTLSKWPCSHGWNQDSALDAIDMRSYTVDFPPCQNFRVRANASFQMSQEPDLLSLGQGHPHTQYSLQGQGGRHWSLVMGDSPSHSQCRGGGAVLDRIPARAQSRQLINPLPMFLPFCPLTASSLTAQSTISILLPSSPRPALGDNSALGCTRILHCPFRTIHSPNSSRLPLLFRFLVGGGRVLEWCAGGLGQVCAGARLREEGVGGSGLNSSSCWWSRVISSIVCSWPSSMI